MRRDMDLCRQILIKLEGRSWRNRVADFVIDGHSREEISYHVKLLHEAGLLDAIDESENRRLEWHPRALTWAGHDFLDCAREISRWNKAKKIILEKAGTASFEILKEVLKELTKQALGMGSN